MRRRDFLKAAGAAGLFVTFPLLPQETERIPQRLPGYPSDLNAYLRISPEGRVGCFVGKVELGQGSMTALAMIAADELDVGLDRVDMTMGDTDLCPWDVGTFGSLSIWQFGPVLRAAAAEARAVLVQMAAERLGVPAARLQVEDGVVSAPGDPRRVTYGELVQGRRIERRLEGVRPKPLARLKVVGRPAPRKDAREKVTGAAKYAADFRAEGMLHACILRPPAHGARLLSADVSEAEKVPGARVVRDGDLVAVLHARSDVAREALGRVKAAFAPSPSVLDDRTIYAHLEKAAPPAQVLRAKGSLEAGEAAAVKRLDADYLNAYVAHAPIEPHAALAQWKDGRMTVWASTQAPFMVKAQVAQAAGLAPRDVRIVTPFVGGGFGGKSSGPQAVEAARLAKLAGCPVMVAWDRREEFFLDAFRPAAVVKIRSGLDREGRIAFWDHFVIGAGEREAAPAYDIPVQRVRFSGSWMGGNPAGLHPFEVGPWRAPSANTNVFARESHMDALAAKAAEDPLAFRLRHTSDPRMVRVLEAVRDRFGWKPAPAPSGRGVGVACAAYRDTLVAAMAEVALDRSTGEVKVRRVVIASAMGLVVNPDGARQQMEGCVTMGLGFALAEEVPFEAGRVLAENFDRYVLPRFSWLPDIRTVLVPDGEVPPQGCGEPAITVMGALLANAIHDAAGIRLLRLPMTPTRILQALQA